MVELEINSLVYGGAGLAKLDGKAVFIEDTVDGDVVEAEIYSDKKKFANAKLVKINKPSKYRVEPFCKLAKVCGGCQWQHVDYSHQLEVKARIVKETLEKALKRDINVLPALASPDNKEYRCKIQLPIGQTQNSKRFLSGYYKKNSHELVNIKFCPIQPSVINDITEYLKLAMQEKNLNAYNEKTQKGMIRHLVFRYSQTNGKILVIFVVNSKSVAPDLKIVAESLMRKYPQVSGVCANFNKANSNLIMSDAFETICGDDYIEENLEGRKFRISRGSFFQVNPSSAVNIFNATEKIILNEYKTQKPTLLDAYSGVGSFSVWLKDAASKICAVEEYPQAVADAKKNLELNDAANIELIEGDAQLVMDKFVEEGKNFDVVLVDPPRKGCSAEAVASLSKLAAKDIIYISCNPATLARDAKLLEDAGFELKNVQPVDMFCHTHHIESVAWFRRL